MALTHTLPLELPRARPAPPLWAPLVAAGDEAAALPITIRSDEPFEPLIAWAAAPERMVEQDAEGITWWLHMPAAGRNNTELVWDPERSKLSVGVWSRDVARYEGVARERPPCRLLWHGALWRPDVDGARAHATLHRGWVRVRLPFAPALAA